MFINLSELRRLSQSDSRSFDKEGYLFVKERTDRLFNQWKSESFIERFCRLKGNLLLIIATKTINDTIDSSSLQTPQDRCVHLLVLEEFAIKLVDESNKHFEFVIEFNRNESIRSFHFATISHSERDEWIQAIHLSSFTYLRSLYQTLVNQLKDSTDSSNKGFDEITDSNYDSYNIRHDSSLLLSISCDNLFLTDPHLEPRLVVFVYYRTLTNCWIYLNKTEISHSRIPQFNKCLAFPTTIHPNSSVQLKFHVYNVIETLTFTKSLLAESYLNLAKLHDSEKERLHKLELRSLVNNQVIGVLAVKLSQCSLNSKLSLRKVSSLYSINDYDNVNKDYVQNNSIAIKDPLIRSHSVPNNIDFDSFNKMSNFNDILDPKLFTNTTQKSFQFSIPKQNIITFIDEFMSESGLSLIIPQIFMNVFMNDEKKLMNCITYSIGEVQTEWQRSQMRALESHLRLVNVLTESLNEISQYQAHHSFRPSSTKNESFLQFVPLNFHLQRCLVSETDSNRKVSQDIFTVGAYCCHYLGFEAGGMKNELFDCRSNNNQQNHINKIWNAMKNFFKIVTLRERIDYYLKALIDSVDRETTDIHSVFEHFNKVDDLCKEIVTILTSKQVDESLAFCESVRGNESVDNSTTNYNNIGTSFERTLSLEETRKSNHYEKQEVRRHKSLPNDDQQEFEPIDLTHLNIRASLISINSKLNNRSNTVSRSDLDPSRRKLKNAIDSLCRTASVCYASAAINLDREQIELFYKLRLRRHMIFTQALTSLIVATMSQLKSVSFLQRAIETRSVLVQHSVLLSCYAEEIGMLEDMAFCMHEINSCVKLVFQAEDDSNFLPRIEGNSFNLRVIFSVPNLPTSLKTIECSVAAVLFNVGINENATLAETFGFVKLQESINKESYSRLEAYINRIFADNPSVLMNMNALKAEIGSNRAKNVRIFDLAEQIVQSVQGLRFTSCKSAKDRTAMAVTLEEARLCSRLFNVSELNDMQLFQKIIDTLRSEGTRRENTRKNVGIAKYAFNSLQLLTFPKLYRAPAGTYSSIET